MRLWLAIPLVSLGMLSPRIASAQQGEPAAGKAVYTKSCATCHGAGGEGKEVIAKALKVQMRHLGSPEVQAKSGAELRKNVVEGVGKMKPVKSLSDKDLGNLIVYLRTLVKK